MAEKERFIVKLEWVTENHSSIEFLEFEKYEQVKELISDIRKINLQSKIYKIKFSVQM